MYIIPTTQTAPTASDLGQPVEARPVGGFAQVLKDLMTGEKLVAPTPDVPQLAQEQGNSEGVNSDENELFPDVPDVEVLRSDELIETDLLSVNLQIEKLNAVMPKRGSGANMTMLPSEFDVALSPKNAGLPAREGVLAPQVTAENTILPIKKLPAEPIWAAARQFNPPSATPSIAHPNIEEDGLIAPNTGKSNQVLPAVALRGSGMVLDPAKQVEPLPATAQSPLPENDRVVSSVRVRPDQNFHPTMNAATRSPVPADTSVPSVRDDQSKLRSTNGANPSLVPADTSVPNVRGNERNLPSINGANPSLLPANTSVQFDATKLVVMDEDSVESALSLSPLDTPKVGPMIATHPADVRNPIQTFTPATAQQLAVAVHKTQDGVTSLVLNPEELGRVRLAISTQDGIMAVTITTERAETQDLMRRHIEMLAQEMRELGYESVGFSFEGRGGGDDKGQTTPERIIEQEMLHADTPPAATAAQSGLDLRL
ncbi:MAG: hypothetical protein ACI9HB_000291 [Gammaproteobacteria bacterium]|jgi:hypothetical protein